MLLTFRPESLEKIRQGRKTTTIRRNAKRWTRWVMNHPARQEDGYPLHIYEGNPRSGGNFVAVSSCISLFTTYGHTFGGPLARDDGFSSVPDLIDRLVALHGMTKKEVEEEEWAVIEFDPAPIREAL